MHYPTGMSEGLLRPVQSVTSRGFCTGCACEKESNSRSLSWSSSVHLGMHWCMTYMYALTALDRHSDVCCSTVDGHTPSWIGVSQRLDDACGTRCQRTSMLPTLSAHCQLRMKSAPDWLALVLSWLNHGKVVFNSTQYFTSQRTCDSCCLKFTSWNGSQSGTHYPYSRHVFRVDVPDTGEPCSRLTFITPVNTGSVYRP